jgi:farnesyl-diphosphate farnesyltransferase
MTDLDQLLEKTSRTFALSIPPLAPPLRDQVTIAYLLFRIADTFEDAVVWSAEKRVSALSDFVQLLGRPDAVEGRRLADEWVAGRPAEHSGYLELLASVPIVLARFAALPQRPMAVMRDYVARSAEGMAAFVTRGQDGQLQLDDVADLKAYCYAVAGIVGEMLTELFLLDAPQLAPVAAILRARAAAFGEALQLVNILKDSAADRLEGRSYLPPGVPLTAIFELARTDLVAANEYVRALQRENAPRGVVAFTAVPVQLAFATLAAIEANGAGSKISRAEVFLLIRQVNNALDHERPAVRLPEERPRRSRLAELTSMIFGRP